MTPCADHITCFWKDRKPLGKSDFNYYVNIRLIEGDYPDYQQIIPTNFRTEAVIEKQEFLNAIKTAGIFAQANNNSLSVEITKSGQIKISAVSAQYGEERTQFKAKVKGEGLKIIFDYRYLQDGLNNINTENVVLKLVDNNAPAVLIPETEKTDFVYVIMPIRQ